MNKKEYIFVANIHIDSIVSTMIKLADEKTFDHDMFKDYLIKAIEKL